MTTNTPQPTQGKCNRCGKWITLCHKTKRNPLGKLRRHLDHNHRQCWTFLFDKTR